MRVSEHIGPPFAFIRRTKFKLMMLMAFSKSSVSTAKVVQISTSHHGTNT